MTQTFQLTTETVRSYYNVSDMRMLTASNLIWEDAGIPYSKNIELRHGEQHDFQDWFTMRIILQPLRTTCAKSKKILAS